MKFLPHLRRHSQIIPAVLSKHKRLNEETSSYDNLNSLFLSIPRFSTIDRSIYIPRCNISIEFDWKTKGQVNHLCLTRLEFLFKLLINPICHCCRYTTSICYSVLYDNIKIICSCFREILWNYKQIIFILCSVFIRMF